ncbi:MAG: hypothetical protein ACLSG5_15380 [Oscillospiraceae bacterium]
MIIPIGIDIKNTARIQLINVCGNLAAIPNDTYESIKVAFTVTGLSGNEAAADDNTAAAEDWHLLKPALTGLLTPALRA